MRRCPTAPSPRGVCDEEGCGEGGEGIWVVVTGDSVDMRAHACVHIQSTCRALVRVAWCRSRQAGFVERILHELVQCGDVDDQSFTSLQGGGISVAARVIAMAVAVVAAAAAPLLLLLLVSVNHCSHSHDCSKLSSCRCLCDRVIGVYLSRCASVTELGPVSDSSTLRRQAVDIHNMQRMIGCEKGHARDSIQSYSILEIMKGCHLHWADWG